MAENLNYRPPKGNSWCYNNGNSYCNKYGRLYDWNTTRTACPSGWHLPSRREWNDLVTVAGGDVASKKLKAKSGWNENGNGTDDYGFSALPGGRYYGNSFDEAGKYGYWWTATEDYSYEAYGRSMSYGNEYVEEYYYGKIYGRSVRCVRD